MLGVVAGEIECIFSIEHRAGFKLDGFVCVKEVQIEFFLVVQSWVNGLLEYEEIGIYFVAEFDGKVKKCMRHILRVGTVRLITMYL